MESKERETDIMRTRTITLAALLLLALLLGSTATAYGAQNLELKRTYATLGLKEKAACIQLADASVSPTACTYKPADKKILSVSKSGVVTAKRVGKTTVTVSYGGKKATVTVRVKAAAKAVKLTETALTLGVGENFDIDSKVTDGASYQRTFTSTDNRVATVRGSIIRALQPGKTTIQVRTFNGKTAACTVTVKPAPAEMQIKGGDTVIQKGANNHKVRIQLNTGAAAKMITYKIQNTSIATVSSNGYITGKAKGTTVLTVRTYNGLEDQITVRVQDKALSLNANAAQLALDYANVSQIIYGQSVQKRNLEGYIVTPADGKYKKTLFIDFAVHGFEDAYAKDGKKLTALANQLIAYFAAHPDELGNYRLVIVPCANPDGTIAGKNNKRACKSAFGRCTAKHIDMNRDFGPFKAKETRALRDFILDSKPNLYINAHGWLNETLGTKKLCKIVNRSLNLKKMKDGVYAADSGYAIGWVHKKLNIPCCLLEYKSPKALSKSANVRMIKEIIKAYQ